MLSAPQTVPALPPPALPSGGAPSARRPHNRDRESAGRACCRAPRHQKSPPRRLPAASIALRPPCRRWVRGRCELRSELHLYLLSRFRPTLRLPAATKQPHRPRAADDSPPHIRDSRRSPATAPLPPTAAPPAHNKQADRAQAPLPADQPSHSTVLRGLSTLQKKGY